MSSAGIEVIKEVGWPRFELGSKRPKRSRMDQATLPPPVYYYMLALVRYIFFGLFLKDRGTLCPKYRILISVYENTEIRSLHYANITRTKTKKKVMQSGR